MSLMDFASIKRLLGRARTVEETRAESMVLPVTSSLATSESDSMSDDFSEEDYLSLYPDVREAVRSGAFSSGRDHWEHFGKAEGRRPFGKPQLDRRQKILSGLNLDGLGLEIGPSHSPIAPKSEGFRVEVLDCLDATALREKFRPHVHLGISLDRIEEVDYVWTGQPLAELIGERGRYDWIVASHVIEHVPDLVEFLKQCELLLGPGGVLSLAVPDMRYCFDCLQPGSSTGVVLDAYLQQRTRPTPGAVFDHHANQCRNGAVYAWTSSSLMDLSLNRPFNEAIDKYFEVRDQPGVYVDVHCWRFTPSSFRLILDDLARLRLTRFAIVNEPPPEGCEFYVQLKVTEASQPSNSADERLKQLLLIQEELRLS